MTQTIFRSLSDMFGFGAISRFVSEVTAGSQTFFSTSFDFGYNGFVRGAYRVRTRYATGPGYYPGGFFLEVAPDTAFASTSLSTIPIMLVSSVSEQNVMGMFCVDPRTFRYARFGGVSSLLSEMVFDAEVIAVP